MGLRGPKKGTKFAKTLAKEELRAILREEVAKSWRPMIRAQVDNCTGISHFMLRDPESGQFKRLTDPDQIAAALNAPNAAEGSTYYIYAKDPSIQAFTDLANRTIDKPTETMDVHVTGDEARLQRLQEGRKRAAKK